jgi:hypothetical protein
MTQPQHREPGRVIDEPSGPQLLTGATASLGILLLMGLFAFSTGGLIHGWWWALFAVPAVLVAAAIASAYAMIEAYR